MTTRPTGVIVHRLDLASVLPSTEHAYWTYALATDRAGRQYALNSQGVGWPVTDSQPLEVETYGRVHVLPLAEVLACPAEDVDLADFISPGGDRLEGNFLLWHQRLTVRETPIPDPSPESLNAIDAIRAALMACNAADLPLAWQRTPGVSPDPTAMGYLSVAGERAWTELGFPGEELWDMMGDSGEDARYCLRYWREHCAPDVQWIAVGTEGPHPTLTTPYTMTVRMDELRPGDQVSGVPVHSVLLGGDAHNAWVRVTDEDGTGWSDWASETVQITRCTLD